MLYKLLPSAHYTLTRLLTILFSMLFLSSGLHVMFHQKCSLWGKSILTPGKIFSHQAKNSHNKENIFTAVEKLSQHDRKSHGNRKNLRAIEKFSRQ